MHDHRARDVVAHDAGIAAGQGSGLGHEPVAKGGTDRESQQEPSEVLDRLLPERRGKARCGEEDDEQQHHLVVERIEAAAQPILNRDREQEQKEAEEAGAGPGQRRSLQIRHGTESRDQPGEHDRPLLLETEGHRDRGGKCCEGAGEDEEGPDHRPCF